MRFNENSVPFLFFAWGKSHSQSGYIGYHAVDVIYTIRMYSNVLHLKWQCMPIYMRLSANENGDEREEHYEVRDGT